ncbi:MAG: acetyl-CoA carboxyl transferase [Comamonadaceae bacterium BICA1-1]|nr:MAG: acetyl-CoA carboxyl transferase [Comamonadaceae bacterium BICA1-1]
MPFFARPHYRSDTTEFLDALKSREPELEAQQRQGRALLWDKPVDRPFWQEAQAGKVAQKPYVYQTEPTLR